MTKLERIEKLEEMVQHHEYFKKSYFWTPPANSAQRRAYEKNNSVHYEFAHKKKKYEVNLEISCSCQNIYYKANIYVNGERKNIRAIKKVIRELKKK